MNPRTVLVISPQPWMHIRISKHNYAIALARQGHKVVFMNPPVNGLATPSLFEESREDDRLEILSYRVPWFARLRFHLPSVFDWLMERQLKRMLQTHQIVPDIVWCFDLNLFPTFGGIAGAAQIFHPVDPLSEPRHIQSATSADLVLTVSTKIADQLAPAGRPVHVINHGLAEPFERLARVRQAELKGVHGRRLTDQSTSKRRPQVGYAGNLGRGPVNRQVLRQIVQQNAQADFHFWGPAEATSNDVTEFIEFLRGQSHVTLYGAVTQEQLADGYCRMDLFLLSYLADLKESDRSNSHKILEYLSTGRVVVSSRIQAYEDTQNLLMMSGSETDADLPEIFAKALATLSDLNSVALQLERIALALDNTYDRQIDRIFKLLKAANS